MKHRPGPAALLALLLALAGCVATRGTQIASGPPPSLPSTGGQAERPNYILGDRWIRNDGIWEVIRIEPGWYVFSASTGEELHLTKDLALARYWTRVTPRRVSDFGRGSWLRGAAPVVWNYRFWYAPEVRQLVIFSYYLVDGLKGVADLNHDGIISLQELYEYLEQQVTAKSRSVGGNQHPVMKGELEGVLPLAKVRAR